MEKKMMDFILGFCLDFLNIVEKEEIGSNRDRKRQRKKLWILLFGWERRQKGKRKLDVMKII